MKSSNGANLIARLLIVEDELNIRNFLKFVLEKEKYSVEEAASGKEALTLLDQKGYDLMVLDLNLPDVDGISVLTQGRLLQPNLAIVILTAYPSTSSAISAVKLQATDYLCKPVTAPELRESVNQALQKRAKEMRQQQMVQAISQAIDNLREPESVSTPAPVAEQLKAKPVYVHPFELDHQKLEVTIHTSPHRVAQLTEGEAAILTSLMNHPNQVLTCRKLVHSAMGYDTSEIEAKSVVRPIMFRLRQKIELNSKEPRLIRTVRGRGYLFDPAAETAP